MFHAINESFRNKKNEEKNDKMILESVLGVTEVLPGSDEDIEDSVDVDSVPDDVYRKVDAELDEIVSDPSYDDTEAEELLGDEEDDISDDEIEAVLTEAVNAWYDPRGIHHPCVDLRDGNEHQPLYRAPGQQSL